MSKKRRRTLSEELAELERTDPAVRAAAESYDRMLDRTTGSRLTELRRSGAAGVHGDRRLKRLRTRKAQRGQAKGDWD